MSSMGFTIEQVVDLLGLERGGQGDRRSFNVKCPVCDKKGHHMNVDKVKDAFRCPKCGESGGMLALYVRFGMGYASYSKEAGQEALKQIREHLNLGMSDKIQYRTDKPNYVEEITLTDSELHRIYSELLDIPVLRLSSVHKENLYKRGLKDSDIEANQYRSLPDSLYFPKGEKLTYEEFNEKLNDLFIEHPELKKIGKRNIISGLYIGSYLSNVRKLKLDNVPGFFKISDMWCYKYNAGMIIPVRNHKKEIVGIQVRTDSGKLRYMTVSSKGLDCGTTGKTRVHFPLNNPEINGNTVIRLTEGPLKSDVALSLTTDKSVAYISVMGVNASKSLEEVLRFLKETGCKSIVNALDMDRFTNPHVARGSRKLNQMIKNNGFNQTEIVWDRTTAQKVFENQSMILYENNIDVEYSSEDIFYRILKNTLVLSNAKIEIDSDWPNNSAKGIDDYLKVQKT